MYWLFFYIFRKLMCSLKLKWLKFKFHKVCKTIIKLNNTNYSNIFKYLRIYSYKHFRRTETVNNWRIICRSYDRTSELVREGAFRFHNDPLCPLTHYRTMRSPLCPHQYLNPPTEPNSQCTITISFPLFYLEKHIFNGKKQAFLS